MKIVLTPEWFLGSDVLIETFSFFVLLAFFIISIKNYKINKNRNSLYFGIGFLAVALAEISVILTKVVLYYDMSFTQNVGQMVVTYNVVKSVDFFYYLGFFFHKLLTLAGLYIIYRIPIKRSTKRDVVLGGCFILLSAVFSYTFNYLFHLTALVLLVLIISNYYEIYKKNKFQNTKVLIWAFGILAFSQILMLSKSGLFYVFAQLCQLASYIILLVLIIKIYWISHKKISSGKKKF